MKYLTAYLPTHNMSYQKEITHKNYNYICIENEHDAQVFAQYNSLIKSRQSVNFWMGFKSQSYRNNMVDYQQHDGERDNIMANVMATRCNLSETEVSMLDYCNLSDKIIEDMNRQVLKFIHEGRLVRIADTGGYCPIDDLKEYDNALDINEEEALNFMLHKSIDFNFEITKPTIVIENAPRIPKELIEEFCVKTNTDKESIQVFNSFKQRTILFQIVDYKTLFENGIKNGLKNIVVETSAQDVKQLDNMKYILQSVMFKFPEKTLNVYINVFGYNKPIFETDSKNINIIFLNK